MAVLSLPDEVQPVLESYDAYSPYRIESKMKYMQLRGSMILALLLLCVVCCGEAMATCFLVLPYRSASIEYFSVVKSDNL